MSFRRAYSLSARQIMDTLNLPNTKFPQRVNYSEVEDKFKALISIDLYESQNKDRKDSPLFTIHDGPPFANGELHIGHALNKMLKDTILRLKLAEGYRIQMRPGWDCHGLPIEHKALCQSSSLEPLRLRSLCKNFAEQAIESQKRTMMKWGLMADYTNPIITMDPHYEASQLKIFSRFVEKGLVHIDKRPVYWSPSSKTALAEAELEYSEDHISLACLIRFPLIVKSSKDTFLLIWTTTPWTVPANQAISINSNIPYVSCQIGESSDQIYIMARSRVSFVEDILGAKITILSDNLKIEDLLNQNYRNINGDVCKIINGSFVTEDTGTGLVHLAPCYGQDDFNVCRENGINEIEIVNEDGTFNKKAPLALQGRCVIKKEGIEAAVKFISDTGLLMKFYEYSHRYPYDWRTRKPVIQMATNQWFINISSIQDILLNALDKVEFTPKTGKKRLINMITSRSKWCISRQRQWGVPIPVFYKKDTNEPLLDVKIIRYFIDLVSQKGGTNIWWSASIEELLPPGFKHLSNDLIKGFDTMDVWFDSGSFWGVASEDPADIYIEGTDQFRGWFQSSFVTAVVSKGAPPFKNLISHGFVLDEKGAKMSKSAGNVIRPDDILGVNNKNRQSTDVLRLWAISSEYLSDVNVGSNSISTLV